MAAVAAILQSIDTLTSKERLAGDDATPVLRDLHTAVDKFRVDTALADDLGTSTPASKPTVWQAGIKLWVGSCQAEMSKPDWSTLDSSFE